ncbi:hypothetical protein F3Y22_tig00112981pilonHSYRG00042 [Hibiscus syriacus]|uniref:Short-chain dehydrogenase TIC 32 n=1 Tax=Hibiscus syriacus TaxID=106335 RepID=A0A6A2WQY9_HIBSY|nr:hypothetical protein F3Y22_tig00112981pilonHSYRG00042 [Hibiscus syriacus]
MFDTVKYLFGTTGASGFGSKSTSEEVTGTCPDLRSITAIITGATSGIGAETARVLAMRGARLVLPARNLKAAEETKARIVSEFPESEIVVMALDLSSLSSVRDFVSEFEHLNFPLNLLINNAGKFAHQHAISDDGIEMTFATNYLAAGKHDDQNGETNGRSRKNSKRVVNEYDATRAYALSKLANVLHTKELAQKLKQVDANVTVNCVHPGIARTRLTREREGFITDLVFFLASKLLKTIPQAAATTCYVATHPKLVNTSGKYFEDCNEASTSKLGSNSNEAAKLWAASEIMVPRHAKAVFDPLNALGYHDM